MISQLPRERKHEGHQNQLPDFSPADLGGYESHVRYRTPHRISEQSVVRAEKANAVGFGESPLIHYKKRDDLAFDS